MTYVVKIELAKPTYWYAGNAPTLADAIALAEQRWHDCHQPLRVDIWRNGKLVWSGAMRGGEIVEVMQ
jgi:hypothetical protein